MFCYTIIKVYDGSKLWVKTAWLFEDFAKQLIYVAYPMIDTVFWNKNFIFKLQLVLDDFTFNEKRIITFTLFFMI